MLSLKFYEGATPGKSQKVKKDPIEVKKRYEQSRERDFVYEWRKGRDWLSFSNGKLFCDICKNSGQDKTGSFVIGCNSLRIDSVKAHEKSNVHKRLYKQWNARNEPVNESPAASALLSLKKADYDRMVLKFRNAHAVAKCNKSFKDYEWLCKLDQVKGLDIGNSYLSDKSAACFVDHIARVSQRKWSDVLKNKAKFFSFTCDGSTDYTGEELESVYVRSSCSGVITDIFLDIGSPESGCSSDIHSHILHAFEKNGLQVDFQKKLVGFCSDGASNMQGNKTGLAALLRKSHPHIVTVHCLAHRLELSFKDIVKKNTLYEKVMTLLLGLYYLYRKSPKLKKGLQRSFEAVGRKQVLPTRVGGTRWLPHLSKAIKAFMKGYLAIRAHLETSSHSNAKAEGLGKIAMDGNVIAFIITLKVLIAPLVKLSLYLQRDHLTLGDASVQVEATKSVLEHLTQSSDVDDILETDEFQGEKLKFHGKKSTCKLQELSTSVLAAIENRFPSTPVIAASSITNFCNWPAHDASSDEIAEYGNEHVSVLVENFSEVLTEAGIDLDECKLEWSLLKQLCYKQLKTDLVKTHWHEINQKLGQNGVSNILHLIDLLLSLPPTSVKNEQVFSLMKLTKNKRRAQMKSTTLNSLLTITTDKTGIQDFDPKEAIEQWMITPSGRKRRVTGYKRGSKKANLDDTVTHPVVVESDDNEQMSSGEEEFDEPASGEMYMAEMTSKDDFDDASDDEDDCEMSEREIDQLIVFYSRE